MKTGNKFAKHLISSVKGWKEMKYPLPGVSPNTSVRDSSLTMRFHAPIFPERIYYIKFPGGKKITSFCCDFRTERVDVEVF